MSLKVVGNAAVAGDGVAQPAAAAPTKAPKKDAVAAPAPKKEKTAKEKVEMKKAQAEASEGDIQVSDGQVINLKLKKDSYFFEVMNKIAQKSDLLRQIEGWKTKTKKAKQMVKNIDEDLEAVEDHFSKNKAKIK